MESKRIRKSATNYVNEMDSWPTSLED